MDDSKILHPSVAYWVGGSERVVHAEAEKDEGEEEEEEDEGQEVRVTDVGNSQYPSRKDDGSLYAPGDERCDWK